MYTCVLFSRVDVLDHVEDALGLPNVVVGMMLSWKWMKLQAKKKIKNVKISKKCRSRASVKIIWKDMYIG